MGNIFSYKDRTVIPFSSNVTVIVGENNSGKSNIARALKRFRDHFPTSGWSPTLWPGSVWYHEAREELMEITTTIEFNQEELDEYKKPIIALPAGTEFSDNLDTDSHPETSILVRGDIHQKKMKLGDFVWGDIHNSRRPAREIDDGRVEEIPTTTINEWESNQFSSLVVKSISEKIHFFSDVRQPPGKGDEHAKESFDGVDTANVLYNLKNSLDQSLERKYFEIGKYFSEFFPGL